MCQLGLTPFFIQSVITKVEIIPLSMGFYLSFDPFVKKEKRMGANHPPNREAATIPRRAKFMR